MQPQRASRKPPRGPLLAPAISSSLPRLLLMLRETAGLLQLSALMLALALCLHAGALYVSPCSVQCLLVHLPGSCTSQASALSLLGVTLRLSMTPLWAAICLAALLRRAALCLPEPLLALLPHTICLCAVHVRLLRQCGMLNPLTMQSQLLLHGAC